MNKKKNKMKGRDGKGASSSDFLVCFPSRTHLTLMPKPTRSPSRPTEPSKRSHHHHHLDKSSHRGGGQASPMLWSKTKQVGSDISEPTSPKVTCAGQIKVRPKSSPCKNWQSVMEKIEKLHNNKEHKKRPSWAEALGFKKEIIHFLTCLRIFRFDCRCYGSFPTSEINSDDENDDEDDGDHQENQVGVNDIDEDSRTAFSKRFTVLEENQNRGITKEQSKETEDGFCAPPSNSLLLMRSRSAPAKSWLEGREDEEEVKKANVRMEEEEQRKKKVMRYETDFYKLSSDIAKETWVVGGIKDLFSRSRSWRR